jgi:predicted nuclease of predicted toxin-antitoxin system
MKFICDVHIAYKIIAYLRKRNCECNHVNHVFADPKTTDLEIARYADQNGLIVITKDSDFRDSYFLKRTPRKLLKLIQVNRQPNKLLTCLKTTGSYLKLQTTCRIFLLSQTFTSFIL